MAVNKKRSVGRPALKHGNLSKQAIVSSATRLLKEGGKVPSIRSVAQDLGVDPMAMYHYYSNKAELLEAVTVSLVEEIYLPVVSKEWKKELSKLCISYLELLKNHAGLMETMLTMSVEGPSQVFSNRLNVALSPLKLDEQTLNDALALLGDYLHGYALAMHCCKEEGLLTTDMMKGPLNFYMRALEA